MAHILLLLILNAWSVLQNTEFLPHILRGLSASLLPPPVTLPCRVQLCLTVHQRGWEAPSGLMVCLREPLSYPWHPRSTELGHSSGDSRSTSSFLLCCVPGDGEGSDELGGALWQCWAAPRGTGTPHLSQGEALSANTISLGKRHHRTVSYFFLATNTGYWFTEVENLWKLTPFLTDKMQPFEEVHFDSFILLHP